MGDRKRFQTIINKKARFDYQVLESIDAGMVLSGAEAKSIRLGQVSLKESYVGLMQDGVQLINAQISPYKFARDEEYEPKRSRKLLLRKKEIERLRGLVAQKGVSLVPLKIFESHGRFKVEVGVVRGKKQFEKREQIRKRDLQRELEKEVKERVRF